MDGEMAMGVQVLNPDKQTLSYEEQQLVDRVYKLSRAAGLTKMPEVGIYNSREVNAFATGPSKTARLSLYRRDFFKKWMTPQWKACLLTKWRISQTAIW